MSKSYQPDFLIFVKELWNSQKIAEILLMIAPTILKP